MTKEFDPMDGLSQDDVAYLNSQRDAFGRQQAAHRMHSTDESRKAAAEAHRRQVMKEQGMEVPDELPVASTGRSNGVTAGVPTMFSVLRALPDTSDGKTLAPAKEQFAPDWSHMKERISAYDGTWIVSRYEFHPHVAFILGFFGKEGWDMPPDAEKEKFEVIVKSGRVFRTDPE